MVTRFKAELTETTGRHAPIRAEFEHRVRSLSLTDAVFAVEWLNATKGTAAQRAVLQIRDELEALGVMLNSLHEQRQNATAKRIGRPIPPAQTAEFQEAVREVEEFGALQKQFHKRQAALNEPLSNYTFCPVMDCNWSSDEWLYNLVPRKPRGRQIEITYQGRRVQLNAATAAAALSRLAVNRELHKVRLCVKCKENWRVSERAIDRFCSPQCRQAFYEAQPSFKERRRKIQKEWRMRDKDKDARARARLKGRDKTPALA